MKYAVEAKAYSDGKTKALIRPAMPKECDQYFSLEETGANYEKYIDIFATAEEAEWFAKGYGTWDRENNRAVPVEIEIRI